MNNDNFIAGLYVFAPHERAASFVKAKLSIKPEQLIEWLKTAKVNEKGYVSIDVLESKNGKWYAKLDTYVRGNSGEKSVVEAANDGEIYISDVPF